MGLADRVPFLSGYSMVAVRTSLNGVDGFPLLVDTGAEKILISRRVEARLGLAGVAPLRFQTLAGVGRSGPARVVPLQSVRVGASTAASLEAIVFDLPPLFRVDGVIGLSFLRRFRVTIEFDTRTLVLRPPPARHP